tara:strand:- start:240 stop:581 length:342 start_codon:yes stop_codon:yes gene_type:complete
VVGDIANCANDSSFEIGKSPEALYDLPAGSTQSRQRTMTDSAANNPVLTFEGKRYDLNTLPDELKELVRGMQVADAQLRMHEDTLKVLAVGRQSLATQLNERLKSVTPLPDQG